MLAAPAGAKKWWPGGREGTVDRISDEDLCLAGMLAVEEDEAETVAAASDPEASAASALSEAAEAGACAGACSEAALGLTRT